MLIKIINKKQKLENEKNYYGIKKNNKNNINKTKEQINNKKTEKKSINLNSDNDKENNKDNLYTKEYTEDDSEIGEKINSKKRVSISSVSNGAIVQNNYNDSNDTSEEKEENEEGEIIEYIKPKKKIIKNNLKEQLKKFKNEQRLNMISKFCDLIFKKIFNDIKNVLKIYIIYEKIKEYQKKCATKIASIYRAYSVCQKFKIDILTEQILQSRKECALKISLACKRFLSLLETKKLLQKYKNNYFIYSSLINNKILYFKYINQNGLEDNLYFEYSPLLRSFILFIKKREQTNKRVIEGNFYNENYCKLTDSLYEINQKGQNVINFQKIFKKADSTKEIFDKISNRYIKLHRPAKRERIDDYEQRKRKAADDNLIRSNSINCKKLGGKVSEMSRSKSFMKLKPKKAKGILKPSKSYINLRCEEKKIHFGNARIKKYHNTKK